MSAEFELDLETDLTDVEDEEQVDSGDGPICMGCGCSDRYPCKGGFIWASATLCSRCA